MPTTSLPLVGLLAIPIIIAFIFWRELIAVLALLSVFLIVIALRVMFGASDLDEISYLHS